MRLVRLNKDNQSWANLETAWQKECESYDEDYSSYAEASLSTLRDECDKATTDPNSDVFALVDEKKSHPCCLFSKQYTVERLHWEGASCQAFNPITIL